MDAITVYGEGRGFRIIWLMEEMGLPHRLRRVDLLAGVENDPEFLAINPGGFIPAIRDGDVTMVESIAILEYLLARYGPSPLAPAPEDACFPVYQQFLHLGEAGLAVPITLYRRSEVSRGAENRSISIAAAHSRRRALTRAARFSEHALALPAQSRASPSPSGAGRPP